MKKTFLLLFFSFTFYLNAQVDTIDMTIDFSDDFQFMSISQRTVFFNHTDEPIKTLGMHAWMNAYRRRLTHLSQRLLEERNSKLYFSEPKDRGKVVTIHSSMPYQIKQDEFVQFELEKPLNPGDTLTIFTDYNIQIPENFFTSYGRRDSVHLLMKYFNMQPVKFYNNGEPEFTHYIDLETLPIKPSFYDIKLKKVYDSIECNIPKINNQHFKGFRLEAITLLVNPEYLYLYTIDSTEVAVNYELDKEQEPFLNDILHRQVRFLKERYHLESEKLLITFKTKKLQNFTGIEDIEITEKHKIKIFTAQEQIDLKMFQMLCYEAIRENLNVDMEKNHWMVNGLLTYMQIHYIQEFYPNLKLAGHLPEDFKVLGIKPLKWFFASDLNLTDRYKLAYLFIVKQNYEQNITTEFRDFNNINKTIISAFKAGIGINYLSDYIGREKFDGVLKNFFKTHSYEFFNTEQIRGYLERHIDKDISWFFTEFIESSDKLNFKLKRFKELNDSLEVTVYNTTDFKGPFKLVGFKDNHVIEEQWFESKGRKANYSFPIKDYDKLVINPGYTLAEFNYRDNYLYTKGVFKNSKKLKPKLYADIENPEFEQIFISPSFGFNNYDKFIIGAPMSNYSVINKVFKYNLNPTFSTGTKSFTGSAKLSYSLLPEKGIFRDVTLNSFFSYYHYDRGLPYLKISNYARFDLKKAPRSPKSNIFLISYDMIDKKPNTLDSTQNIESLKYNLLHLSFLHRNDALIFENYLYSNFEVADLFSKFSTEWYGRYEYLARRKIMLRWFGSFFLYNDAETDYFDTGISKVSDYAFGYSLLARSDNSGIFSQQYVMAQGGFISKIPGRANQWITTLRSEFPIWKMILGYGGVGFYKNKAEDPNFIYETGIKFRLIPDFFELYFPVQSTLGFEPKLDNYASRIRFTFVFNLSALKRYFERGWY